MMKLIVVVAVVLVVLYLVRNSGSNRRADAPPDGARRRGPPGAPQEMVECAACGVHLPRSDALPGPGGRLYCCAEHRQRGG